LNIPLMHDETAWIIRNRPERGCRGDKFACREGGPPVRDPLIDTLAARRTTTKYANVR